MMKLTAIKNFVLHNIHTIWGPQGLPWDLTEVDPEVSPSADFLPPLAILSP